MRIFECGRTIASGRICIARRYNTPIMHGGSYNLAIETSSRRGGVSVGRGDALLETVELPEQRRHAMELLPAIDAVCGRQGIGPADIGEIYISVGPGSFTGLRIGVTTAKVLGRTVGCCLVAVPTLDAVVQNAPVDHAHVAIMLNAKRGQCFTGLYERCGDTWAPLMEPSLLAPAQLLDHRSRLGAAGGPLAIIADKLPDFDWPDDVECLDPALATPRSQAVWRLGQQAAAEGRFVSAFDLSPLYVRLPEAEEVWRAKQHN